MGSSPIALALTSRQLYLEAISIYYSKNTFCFPDHYDSPHVLPEFLTAIRPHNASNIIAARFIPPYGSMFSGPFLSSLYPDLE